MTSTTNRNGCRKTQIRTRNKTISLYFRANKEGQLVTNRISWQNLEVLRPSQPVVPVAEGVRLKVEIIVKQTYFTIELSILKHPVVTVVNQRRKESNYGQELAFQSKQRTTTETSWKGRQARWIKVKIITF